MICLLYTSHIHKIASTRLSFCSCMAARHIHAPKYVPSCKHESHILGHVHGSESLHNISFIFFYHHFYTVFPYVAGIGPNGISALHDAVFDAGVVTQIYIIENNGISDHAVISNEYFLKQYRILHRAIDDTAAGNQTVLHISSCIIFCRRKILNLGINIRVIVQKMLSHICFCLLYTSRCV